MFDLTRIPSWLSLPSVITESPDLKGLNDLPLCLWLRPEIFMVIDVAWIMDVGEALYRRF